MGINSNNIILNIPYFLGSLELKNDISFEEGENLYLKDVIAPILNSLQLNKIKSYDVSSNVIGACINNFQNINNNSLFKFFLKSNNFNKDNLVLVSSYNNVSFNKIYKTAKDYNINNILFYPGQIKDIKTGIDFSPIYNIKNPILVIIDDICDEGNNYIECAKLIKEKYSFSDIYLVVSHFLFSEELNKFSNYFENIYCTNSISDINKDYIDGFVKQLVII